MMGSMSELITEWRIAYPPHPRPRDGVSTYGTHPCDDDDDGDEEYGDMDL